MHPFASRSALALALTLSLPMFVSAQVVEGESGSTVEVQDAAQVDVVPEPTGAPAPAYAPAVDAAPAPQPEPASASYTPNSLWGRAVYGARLALALPAGGLYGDAPTSDWIGAGLQVQLDVNFKLDHTWLGGFYFGLVFPSTSGALVDDCDSYGHSCSVFGIEFGAQGEYHVQPAEAFDPWFGGSVAIEGLIISETGPSTDVSLSLTGPNFGVSGGANFRIGGFSFGPFITYKLGWYGSVRVDYGGYGSRGEVNDTALHHWLLLGVRGTFAPWQP